MRTTYHFNDRVEERLVGIDAYIGQDLTPIFNLILAKAAAATTLVTYTNRDGRTERYVLITVSGRTYGVGVNANRTVATTFLAPHMVARDAKNGARRTAI